MPTAPYPCACGDCPRSYNAPPRPARRRGLIRTLGDHPETGLPIHVIGGTYGYYIRLGKTELRASLHYAAACPANLTTDRATAIIAERYNWRERQTAAAKTDPPNPTQP